MDKYTSQRIKTLHPDVRDEVFKMFTEAEAALGDGVKVRMTQALRSFKEQQDIYKQGRFGNKGPIVTWAAAGKSYHNYGLAFDIVLLIKGDNKKYNKISYNTKEDYDGDNVADWEELTAIFVNHGWFFLTDKNGRRFDYPHFQKSFGYSVGQLLIKSQTEGQYPVL